MKAQPSYLSLVVSPVGPRDWRLCKDWPYTDGRWTLTVPAGFETDLASVPRFFWRLVPPFGCYLGAAVVHDFLYSAQSTTRKEADRIFLTASLADGERLWRANAMYVALRLFGWWAWRRARRASEGG